MDQNQNPKQPVRRGGWSTLLLPIVLVVGLVLTFYFLFIAPSSRSSRIVPYTVAQLDLDRQAYEDNNKEYKLDMGGDLTDILLGEKVTKLVSQANDNARYYIVQGSYEVTDIKNKTQEIVFQVVINYDHYTAWDTFNYIISERVQYKTDAEGNIAVDANGNYIIEGKYYSGENNIYVQSNPDSGNGLASWLPMILITVVLIGVTFFLVSRLGKSMKDASRGQMDFNTSRARKEVNSKIRFADVAGCEEVKAELVEVVDYFRNAEKYTKLGAKLPKGVLLVGPPGTGKTLLAKAVAGEANVAFYSISGSDFVEMYVGVGAGRVRDMFKTAKQNAPCLIFIDEIDAVGRQRGAGLGGGNDEREQTLNQLLVEMDGFNDNSGIIIMAATNRADILDPALTRAGRFDRQITVDLPDKKGREAILKVHSRGKTVDPSVDFANIASRTVGFSGADLANIMNDAAILAVRAHRTVILTKDIDEAIDRSISGPARSSTHMSIEEKRQVAYHESGHAIIGLKLPYSDIVQKVTIVPRGNTGGHVLMTPENDRFLMTKNQMLARITGYLGGRSSEEIFFKDVSTGASNDIEVATKLARAMVTVYGMSSLGPVQYDQNNGSVFLGRDYADTSRNFSAQIAYEIDKEIRNIIDTCHQTAVDLITEYKDDVTLIAETLITKETLTSEEIKYLLEHRELPPEPVAPEVITPEVSEAPAEEIVKKDFISSLPPEFNTFIEEFKRAVEKSPKKLVVVAGVPGSINIDMDQLKRTIHRFAPNETFVGTVVLSRTLYARLPVKIEEFVQEFENTMDGGEILLIKTSDTSAEAIRASIYPVSSLEESLKKAKTQDKDSNVIDADSTPHEENKDDNEDK